MKARKIYDIIKRIVLENYILFFCCNFSGYITANLLVWVPPGFHDDAMFLMGVPYGIISYYCLFKENRINFFYWVIASGIAFFIAMIFGAASHSNSDSSAAVFPSIVGAILLVSFVNFRLNIRRWNIYYILAILHGIGGGYIMTYLLPGGDNGEMKLYLFYFIWQFGISLIIKEMVKNAVRKKT